MSTMNTVQTQTFVKAHAVETMNLVGATQIGDFTYAIPVEVEGATRYAKVVVTCTNNKDTKTTDAFDLAVAVQKYAEERAEKEQKAKEKAEEKARKEAKRNSKK